MVTTVPPVKVVVYRIAAAVFAHHIAEQVVGADAGQLPG